jgi:hypothetical protein
MLKNNKAQDFHGLAGFTRGPENYVLYYFYFPIRVAASGVEPDFGGYEPPVVPFHQAA